MLHMTYYSVFSKVIYKNFTYQLWSVWIFKINIQALIISALVAIFDRVGLLTNVDKTVSMACQPCRAGSGNRTPDGYRRRVTGEGLSYRERQRERVACGECGEEIAAGSLSGHLMTRHGRAATRRHLWAPQTTGGPRTYKIAFPRGSRRQCPVEGCPGVSATLVLFACEKRLEREESCTFLFAPLFVLSP